jgi:hypothetical protein
MRTLFGDVPEPWTEAPNVELDEVCLHAGERTLRQPMVAFAETDAANAPDVVVEVVFDDDSESVIASPPPPPRTPRRRLAAGSLYAMKVAAAAAERAQFTSVTSKGPYRESLDDALDEAMTRGRRRFSRAVTIRQAA